MEIPGIMNPARLKSFGQVARLVLGLGLGSAAICSHAHAQSWLPDRQYAEGPGFQAGNLEIHPGVALRGGYANNVFLADGKTRDGVTRSPQGSAILAVTPHLYVSTEGKQRSTQGEDRQGATPELKPIVFRGGVAATYFKYFMDYGPNNIDVDTDLYLGIAPGRAFGVDLQAGYLRSIRPFAQSLGKTRATSKAYVFDTIDPKVRFRFGSKSQVLTGFLGYGPKITIFESSIYDYLSNLQHGVDAGTAWKFLPSTALIFDGSVGFQRYINDASTAPLIFSDNTLFKSRLGINGAITNSVALRGMVGYALAAVKDARLDDHEDVVGEAMASYFFGPHKLDLGYQRDVQASALGAWMQIDRGYAKLGMLFGGALALSLDAGAGQAKYGRLLRPVTGGAEPLGENNVSQRKDIRIDAAVRLEYRVTDYLAFMADGTFQSVITDFAYAASGAAVPDPAGFNAFQAYGGVRAHY
jgi:hypothetical protein